MIHIIQRRMNHREVNPEQKLDHLRENELHHVVPPSPVPLPMPAPIPIFNPLENDDNPIDYSNAIEIEEIDPEQSKQNSAVERACYLMNLDQKMPDCFQMSLTKINYYATLLLNNKQDEIFEFDEMGMR